MISAVAIRAEGSLVVPVDDQVIETCVAFDPKLVAIHDLGVGDELECFRLALDLQTPFLTHPAHFVFQILIGYDVVLLSQCVIIASEQDVSNDKGFAL